MTDAVHRRGRCWYVASDKTTGPLLVLLLELLELGGELEERRVPAGEEEVGTRRYARGSRQGRRQFGCGQRRGRRYAWRVVDACPLRCHENMSSTLHRGSREVVLLSAWCLVLGLGTAAVDASWLPIVHGNGNRFFCVV